MIKSILFDHYDKIILLPFSAVSEIICLNAAKVEPAKFGSLLEGYYQHQDKLIPIIKLPINHSHNQDDSPIARLIILYLQKGVRGALYFKGVPKILYIKPESIKASERCFQFQNSIYQTVIIDKTEAVIPDLQFYFNGLI